jgi:hypothetical protein
MSFDDGNPNMLYQLFLKISKYINTDNTPVNMNIRVSSLLKKGNLASIFFKDQLYNIFSNGALNAQNIESFKFENNLHAK